MYVWLCVQFGFFLLAMLILLVVFIAITVDIADGNCDGEADCVARKAVWYYLGWFAVLLLGSPL